VRTLSGRLVSTQVSRKERQLGAMGIVPVLQALQAALS
jgi:hypothetical protein